MNNSLVSVVVPTFNSGETINECLRSIQAQTFANKETIVVDNLSSDSTVERSKSFGVGLISAKTSMSQARNLGTLRSKGEFVFNIDSDFVLSEGLVEECVNMLRSGYDAVSIRQEFLGSGYWGTCRRLENLTYKDDPVVQSPRFYSRKLFDQIGGYDETLTAGEDYDFALRLQKNGFKIGFAKRVLYHHEPAALKSLILKKYKYGKTIRKFAQKHKSAGMEKFLPIRPQWFSHRKVLYEEPTVILGIPFLKFMQYCGAVFGVIAGAE